VGEFLQTGFGNLDSVQLLDNGNIITYPKQTASSSDQRCKITQKDKDGIIIESEMTAPVEANEIIESLEVDPEGLEGQAQQTVKFVTNITLGKDDQQNLAL